MESPKTYKSKLGLEFRVVGFHRPADGSVVYFTENEYAWIKDQGLRPEEFKAIWCLKKDDYTYNPIPEVPIEQKTLAQKYGDEIINDLKRNIGIIEE